jgi:hypothetical protein
LNLSVEFGVQQVRTKPIGGRVNEGSMAASETVHQNKIVAILNVRTSSDRMMQMIIPGRDRIC